MITKRRNNSTRINLKSNRWKLTRKSKCSCLTVISIRKWWIKKRCKRHKLTALSNLTIYMKVIKLVLLQRLDKDQILQEEFLQKKKIWFRVSIKRIWRWPKSKGEENLKQSWMKGNGIRSSKKEKMITNKKNVLWISIKRK